MSGMYNLRFSPEAFQTIVRQENYSVRASAGRAARYALDAALGTGRVAPPTIITRGSPNIGPALIVEKNAKTN